MSSPADGADDRVVAAGGGAVWRRAADGGLEVPLVHRPRYDDWSLPKGKLDAGEHTLTAAVREVGEETGLAVVAGRRSVRVEYPVPEGPKRVDYWVMQAVGGDFEPSAEVDELRWLAMDEAAELCSHDWDRVVLADLARTDVPLMPTLMLVRHARAGDRSNWDGPDDLRPLDPRGREQARRLAEVLPLFRPDDLLSAPPVRCMRDGRAAGRAPGHGHPAGARAERGRFRRRPGRRTRPGRAAARAPDAARGDRRVQPGRRHPVRAHGPRRAVRGAPRLSRRARRAAPGCSAAGPGP